MNLPLFDLFYKVTIYFATFLERRQILKLGDYLIEHSLKDKAGDFNGFEINYKLEQQNKHKNYFEPL